MVTEEYALIEESVLDSEPLTVLALRVGGVVVPRSQKMVPPPRRELQKVSHQRVLEVGHRHSSYNANGLRVGGWGSTV